jgi:hypothetical protein
LPSITGEGPDIAKAEDGGTVGDDSDEVAARRVVERGVGVGLDGLAGGSDAGGICEREIVLGGHALGGLDLQLSRAREPVVVERRFPQDIVHGSSNLLTLLLHALHDPNNSVEWIGALVWLIPVVTIPEPDYRHRQIRLKRGLVVVQDFGQQGPAGPYYDPQHVYTVSLPSRCIRFDSYRASRSQRLKPRRREQ